MIRVLMLAMLSACAAEPIRWDDPVSGPELAETTPAPLQPSDPGMCPDSFRSAYEGKAGFGTWWRVKSDGTADLMVARSPDGGSSWETPLRADTMDAGRTGCRRPRPSIAVSEGNAHIAYGMTAREGPGVFTVHIMTGMIHAPVAVVYGERYGNTSIAAKGDVVAVAYEDPNTDPRRIGLALSETAAHLFQSRTIVSPPTGEAFSPGVSLQGDTIRVRWNRRIRASVEGFTRTGVVQ